MSQTVTRRTRIHASHVSQARHAVARTVGTGAVVLSFWMGLGLGEAQIAHAQQPAAGTVVLPPGGQAYPQQPYMQPGQPGQPGPASGSVSGLPSGPAPGQPPAPPASLKLNPPIQQEAELVRSRSPAESAVASSTARCRPRFYTFRRGVAVGALSALGAAGLVTAVALTAADGSVYLSSADGYPGDVTWNFQGQYRAAYVLTSLTTLGLGSLLVDWGRLLNPNQAKLALCEVGRSKWNFNRGMAIGALGSLLVTGVLTSVMLTALDGRAYVSDDPSRTQLAVPYRYQTAYSVGYAASAGLALGLGLAVFLP